MRCQRSIAITAAATTTQADRESCRSTRATASCPNDSCSRASKAAIPVSERTTSPARVDRAAPQHWPAMPLSLDGRQKSTTTATATATITKTTSARAFSASAMVNVPVGGVKKKLSSRLSRPAPSHGGPQAPDQGHTDRQGQEEQQVGEQSERHRTGAARVSATKGAENRERPPHRVRRVDSDRRRPRSSAPSRLLVRDDVDVDVSRTADDRLAGPRLQHRCAAASTARTDHQLAGVDAARELQERLGDVVADSRRGRCRRGSPRVPVAARDALGSAREMPSPRLTCTARRSRPRFGRQSRAPVGSERSPSGPPVRATTMRSRAWPRCLRCRAAGR